jgi:Ca2+-binding EF-hand superfamily protein
MKTATPTPESRRDRYRQWFRVYDANRDGYMDEQDFVVLFDLAATVRRAKEGPARDLLGHAARARFLQILEVDTDGDGRVAEAEYLAAALAQPADPGPMPDAALEGMARGGFASFDVNGDGVIDLQDYVLTHVSFGLDPRISEVLARFKLLDTNGNGEITLAEFKPVYLRHQLSADEVPFLLCVE